VCRIIRFRTDTVQTTCSSTTRKSLAPACRNGRHGMAWHGMAWQFALRYSHAREGDKLRPKVGLCTVQKGPARHENVILQVSKMLDHVTVPTARACVIWVIGEYVWPLVIPTTALPTSTCSFPHCSALVGCAAYLLLREYSSTVSAAQRPVRYTAAPPVVGIGITGVQDAPMSKYHA
jgi:hypothetical protein